MSGYGASKITWKCRLAVLQERPPTHKDGAICVQLNSGVSEQASTADPAGMCCIMASVVGDDACSTLACTKGKVHAALQDACVRTELPFQRDGVLRNNDPLAIA
eukprot:325803-Chlamydomonas_euryale.AAC.8